MVQRERKSDTKKGEESGIAQRTRKLQNTGQTTVEIEKREVVVGEKDEEKEGGGCQLLYGKGTSARYSLTSY